MAIVYDNSPNRKGIVVYENILQWTRTINHREPDGYQSRDVCVRVWSARSEAGPGCMRDEHFVHEACRRVDWLAMNGPMDAAKLLLERLGPDVNVNAIEVKFNNVGVLIYPDWP